MPRTTPPRLFLPLVLLLWSAISLWAILSGGCGLTSLSTAAGQARAQEQFDQAVGRAIAAFTRGDTRAAGDALRSAASQGGDRGATYAQIGQDLVRRGHAKEAAAFLQAAVEKPEPAADPTLWATLAEAYRQTGNGRKADASDRQAKTRAENIYRTIDRSRRRADGPAIARLLSAGAYYGDHAGDLARALEVLREAARLAPDEPVTLNALGYTLADKGTTTEQRSEALALTRKAARLALGNPVILDSYGWALFKTGDLPGARSALRAAVDGAPAIPELRYHLGVVYGALGLAHEAERELARALLLRPDYPEAEKARARLRRPPGQGVTQGV